MLLHQYDPFTTSITAASTAGPGNTADLVLDVVKIGTDTSGILTLTTPDNPGGVPMASATVAGAPLPAPSMGVSSLAIAMQGLAKTLSQCFALPVAQRALERDTSIPEALGGSSVTRAAAPCEALTDPGFLHNGFNAGQYFYSSFTSNSMTGAQFSVPQVMQLIPGGIGGRDAAIINARFLDANGLAGNYITVAVNKATGTSTPNWVVYGNQHPVNVQVRSSIRRQQQMAPVTQPAFAAASLSTYQTGIEVFINKDGPGSTNLTAARVTGPGLPPKGLILNRPIASAEPQQSWLNIADKSGGDPGVVAGQRTNCNCDIFFLQRTQDVAGAGASTVRSNPNNANSNSGQFVDWAHPLDYGAATGTPSNEFVPFDKIVAGATYKVELFYGGSSTPTHTFNKTLLSPIIPATQGAKLAWNAPAQAALDLLDPTNALAAAASALTVSWIQHPAAEQIRLAQIFARSSTGTVN
ncbi:hypothetical protein HQN59_09010 [Schlegelella sp. ID0723]|uniref:Uncharacterized protein n=1 Tax=Piscinibacter koreensis TaxID=2742824 RepID=A0A7Y6NMJ8_9BURK|nr:hypothetical protein [Schlegelella koreensis]